MAQGSDKHGPKLDDEIEREMQGVLKGDKPTRVQEEQEPEPTVTDEGEAATDPAAIDDDAELPEDERRGR